MMKRVGFMFLGLICALLVSMVFGALVFKLITPFPPLENWNFLTTSGVSGRALSVGAIPNIGLFYLFLNKENYDSARGVILSFILIGIFILVA